MRLRIWHIPQVPMEPFYVVVHSTADAVLVLNALADYDLFQFDNNVKPDYTNAQGLEIYENGGWSEYYNEVGDNIDDIMRIAQ